MLRASSWSEGYKTPFLATRGQWGKAAGIGMKKLLFFICIRNKKNDLTSDSRRHGRKLTSTTTRDPRWQFSVYLIPLNQGSLLSSTEDSVPKVVGLFTKFFRAFSDRGQHDGLLSSSSVLNGHLTTSQFCTLVTVVFFGRKCYKRYQIFIVFFLHTTVFWDLFVYATPRGHYSPWAAATERWNVCYKHAKIYACSAH